MGRDKTRKEMTEPRDSGRRRDRNKERTKRRRSPSPESDDEMLEPREIISIIHRHTTWTSLLRDPDLFENGIFEMMDWLREVWASRPASTTESESSSGGSKSSATSSGSTSRVE